MTLIAPEIASRTRAAATAKQGWRQLCTTLDKRSKMKPRTLATRPTVLGGHTVHIIDADCAQDFGNGAATENRVAPATTKIKDRSRKRAAHDGPAIDDGVHGALTQAVFEGRLAPGSKLPEHRLAAIFGVSRERVRKVLHRLVAERRLERIPRRGTFVPNPSPEEIRTVYRAHRILRNRSSCSARQGIRRRPHISDGRALARRMGRRHPGGSGSVCAIVRRVPHAAC